MRIAVAGVHTECSTYRPVPIPTEVFRPLQYRFFAGGVSVRLVAGR